jgi:2'-5' RNA ligase
MGYAVELYFDSETEKSIWDLRHALIGQGISSTISELGDRPHISLAVFPNVDCDTLISLTKEYAGKIEPFDFKLSAIGTFPTDENGLFLSPVPTNLLLNCHQGFHDRLAESKITPSAYYIPENWIPHCTVEMNIPDEQLPKAVEVCKKEFKPLLGQFREIGVVEFRPIKHLATWSLVK